MLKALFLPIVLTLKTLLTNRELRGVMWRSMGVVIAMTGGFYVLGWYAIDSLIDMVLGWETGIGWIDAIISYVSGGVSGVLSGAMSTLITAFMLPTMVVLMNGMFQDAAIYALEKKEYADVAGDEPTGFWGDIWHDIGFTVLVIFLNLLILPVYFFGAYFFGVGIFIAIAVNGWLLGREFFETAAGKHLGTKKKAKKLATSYWPAIWFGGMLVAGMEVIPVVNLFVPILGMVLLVHMYHVVRKDGGEVLVFGEETNPETTAKA